MNTNFVRAACLLVGLSTGVMAQVTWTQVATNGGGLYGSAMAYDSQRGRTVHYGGAVSYIWFSSNTQEWDGSTWTTVSGSGPGRADHAMAYDSQRGCVVMFGGGYTPSPSQPMVYLGSTATWNGSGWTTVAVGGPSARSFHAMAHDSQRGRTVMFGGSAGAAIIFGDTWEWDGGSLSWAQVASTGPSARYGHSMAYDSQRGRTVLFGGSSGGSATWEWDGATWTQVATTGPATGGSLAYDSQRAKVVLSSGPLGTWEWDGSLWTQVATGGPGNRGPMVYDSQRGRIVLVDGGSPPPRPTWEMAWMGNQTQTLRGRIEGTFLLGGTTLPLVSSSVDLNSWIGQQALMQVVDIGTASAPVIRVDSAVAATQIMDMGSLHLGQSNAMTVTAPAGSAAYILLDFTSNSRFLPLAGFGVWLFGGSPYLLAGGITDPQNLFQAPFLTPANAALLGLAVSSQALVGDHGNWFFSNADGATVQP